MNRMEQFCGKVRHHPLLKNAVLFWNVVRPVHDAFWRLFARKGIRRFINETDKMVISPRLRRMSDDYEPEVWKSVMRDVRAGDTFVDVGAHIGLYTVAVAKRIGPNGFVYAFEPEASNCGLLCENLRLNCLLANTRVERKAVSSAPGSAHFRSGRNSESCLLPESDTSGVVVEVVTLDEFFKARHIDILKIDVEGFELEVLKGALGLLKSEERRPRVIYVEVHPGRWLGTGATSPKILSLLRESDYEVFSIRGDPIQEILEYGEIVARASGVK